MRHRFEQGQVSCGETFRLRLLVPPNRMERSATPRQGSEGSCGAFADLPSKGTTKRTKRVQASVQTVTPELSRAARAWLNWSQSDLANRANVSLSTVCGFEIGSRAPQQATLTDMRTALEQGGVRFVDLDGLAVGIIRADVEISRFPKPENAVTLTDVETVTLPFIVNGRQIYPNSKRALIIRAIIAVLKNKNWATKREIFETLRGIGLDITNPTLSIVLAEAKGLFYSHRRENGGAIGWSMNNCCDLAEQSNNHSG